MEQVFRFRVLIDHPDDIFRDIEIPADSTFEELHKAIINAFHFDSKQLASFYMSNENWDKGEEISLMNMNDPFLASPVQTMSNTKLNDKLKEKGDKILYVYDFLYMWCFFIDVVEIAQKKRNTRYPRVVHQYGKAPDQYSKSIDIENDEFMSIPEIKPEDTGLLPDDAVDESEEQE